MINRKQKGDEPSLKFESISSQLELHRDNSTWYVNNNICKYNDILLLLYITASHWSFINLTRVHNKKPNPYSNQIMSSLKPMPNPNHNMYIIIPINWFQILSSLHLSHTKWVSFITEWHVDSTDLTSRTCNLSVH